MTFLEMKDELRMMLGPMSTLSPWYTGGYLGKWINRALNQTITRIVRGSNGMGQFTELQTSWTDETVPPNNFLPLPADKIAVTEVQCYRKALPIGQSQDKTYPMKWMPRHEFYTMPKDAEGWPVIWTRSANLIRVWPTPSAAYTSALNLVGVMREIELVDPGDKPRMDEMWHDMVLFMAAYIGATKMGQSEVAREFLTAFTAMMETTLDIGGMEEIDADATTIAGFPTKVGLDA